MSWISVNIIFIMLTWAKRNNVDRYSRHYYHSSRFFSADYFGALRGTTFQNNLPKKNVNYANNARFFSADYFEKNRTLFSIMSRFCSSHFLRILTFLHSHGTCSTMFGRGFSLFQRGRESYNVGNFFSTLDFSPLLKIFLGSVEEVFRVQTTRISSMI